MTHKLIVQSRRNPTEAGKQALLERMGTRYDKVVARKKNKLRELEREAKTYHIVEHMQGIVKEMFENRDVRIQQQFLSFHRPSQGREPGRCLDGVVWRFGPERLYRLCTCDQ